jgi:phage shock protein A
LVQQALHNGRSKYARDVNQKQQSVEDTIKAVLLEDKRQEIREANGQYHLRIQKLVPRRFGLDRFHIVIREQI